MQYVVLTGLIEEDDGKYAASCKELDVVSSGETVEEAAHNLGDAVEAYLNAIEEMGLRDEIFEERGIEIKSARPSIFDCAELRLPRAGNIYIHPLIQEMEAQRAYA